MKLNEDFWDNRKTAVPQEKPHAIRTTTEDMCRFSLDLYFIKYAFSGQTPMLTPDKISNMLKRHVHYIRNSRVMSGANIESLRIELLHDTTTDDGKYYGDRRTAEDYAGELPHSVFGIPVSVTVNDDDSAPRTVIHIYADFTASVMFRSPKDVYDFYAMMFPRHDGMKTYLRITPLYRVGPEKARHIKFFIGDYDDGDIRILNGTYMKGCFVPVSFEKNEAGEYAFKSIYRMFMNVRLLKGFLGYIQRRGKTEEFPLGTINNILTGVDDDE